MTEDKKRSLTRWLTGPAKHVIRIVGYGFVGALLMFVTVVVIVLESRPDLDVWHTVELDEEFTADSDIETFQEYLALEARLFDQLEAEVYGVIPPEEHTSVNRYHHGSLADPAIWPTDWNRTYVQIAETPHAGVLLLHGLSDSPYSLKSLGDAMHARGATVVSIRLPGHGTAPSGLVHVRWEDWAAAVEMAMRHLRQLAADVPLYVVGYSNGGALAVIYTLSALDDDTLPPPDGVVLISPEIGITRLAALASWQERLGRLLGLDKLSWNSINLEYDPYQYRSFALNAGKQAYEITGEIQTRITRLTASGDIERFPSMIAFQSVVDATVRASVLVNGLFDRMPAEGDHELVVFDLNRRVAVEEMLTHDPSLELEAMFERTTDPYTFTLVTNKGLDQHVLARRQLQGSDVVTDLPLALEWPRHVYSLSHIALPFAPDDPLYGGADAPAPPGVQIGNLVMRGERGVLRVSGDDLLRLHWNPFYDYLEQRTLDFMGLTEALRPTLPASRPEAP